MEPQPNNEREVRESAHRQFLVGMAINYATENHVPYLGIVRSLIPRIELEKLRDVYRLVGRIIRSREMDAIDREIAARAAKGANHVPR